MKVSELIEALEAAMAEVGDMEVLIPSEAEPSKEDDDDELFSKIVSVARFEKGHPILICDVNLHDSFSTDS
jgi:hypothetical protein